MPTITTVDVTWETSSTLDAAELRRADTAMFLGDGSNNGVRGGVVRHGDYSLIASINGSDQVTVQPGAAVIPAATGLGVYRASLSATTAATAIDPRNATNPRIDLIVFRSTGAVDIITGTPGASPSAPALPANAIELGRINVPAVGGGAATVSHGWRSYATALGGTIHVETAARLPGSGNQIGQRAVVLGTGHTYEWNGTAWDNHSYVEVTVPALSGFISGTVLRRSGRSVSVTIGIDSGDANVADKPAVQIPAGHRPPTALYFWGVDTGTSAPLLLSCGIDGIIRHADARSLGQATLGVLSYVVP